jgi:hypothetical protein
MELHSADFNRDAGVFRYEIEYGLNMDETFAVSNHYPVYAEFWIDRYGDF